MTQYKKMDSSVIIFIDRSLIYFLLGHLFDVI